MLGEAIHHRLGAVVAVAGAVAERLEVDEHAARVAHCAGAIVAAQRGEHIEHGRIGFHDRRRALGTCGHQRGRDIRIGADIALDHADVFLGHEIAAGGLHHRDAKRHGKDQQQQRLPAHDAPVVHGPVQRALIGAMETLVEALQRPLHATGHVFARRLVLEQLAAQRWRQGERDKRGNDHRHRQRHRELAQQHDQHVVAKQQRREHGHQRQRDRYHRKADLAHAHQRRLQRRLATLHMAHDVFDHHDGVVHHKADTQHQRHQR